MHNFMGPGNGFRRKLAWWPTWSVQAAGSSLVSQLGFCEVERWSWRRRRIWGLRLECNSICCFPLFVIIKRFVVVGFNICIWQSRVSLLWSLSLSLSLICFLGGWRTRLFLLLCFYTHCLIVVALIHIYFFILLLLNNNFWFLVFLRRRHQACSIELQDYTMTTTSLDLRRPSRWCWWWWWWWCQWLDGFFVFPSIITNVSSNSFISFLFFFALLFFGIAHNNSHWISRVSFSRGTRAGIVFIADGKTIFPVYLKCDMQIVLAINIAPSKRSNAARAKRYIR